MDLEDAWQKYERQRRNSIRRNIDWQFDFDSWVAWWRKTRRWNRRGLGRSQYVMSRIDPTGPFSPTNCQCRRLDESSSDYWSSNCRSDALAHNRRQARLRQRPIQTPAGPFKSLKTAAAHYQISSSALRWRMQAHPKDYYYI